MVNKHRIKRDSFLFLTSLEFSPEFNCFTLGNTSIELGNLLGAMRLVDLSLSRTRRVSTNTPKTTCTSKHWMVAFGLFRIGVMRLDCMLKMFINTILGSVVDMIGRTFVIT